MPREKECFRDYIMRLDEKFPDKELLTKGEVIDFLGISQSTMTRRAKEFGFAPRSKHVSKVKLARALS